MATSRYGANAGQIANNYAQWETQNIDKYNQIQELQSSTDNDIIRNIPLIGKPAQAAVDSFLSTIGGIADYAGNPAGIGDTINDYVTAHEMAMGEKPEASFSWDYFMNGLPRDTGGLIGSMASLVIPTLAGVAAAPVVGASVPVAAGIGGIIGAGGEALAEGGNKLRESLASGETLDTAQDKARSVAGKNFAMLAPLNLLELGTFAKVGQGIKNAYRTAKGTENTTKPFAIGNLFKGAGTAGAGALNEGYQEYVQEGIQSSAEPNEYYSYIPGYGNEQQNEAFASTVGPMLALGGLGGGARMAAGKLGQYAKPDELKLDETTEGVTTQPQFENIPSQANYTIADEVSDANLSQGTESKLRMLDEAYYKQYGQHLYVTSMTRHWGTNSDHETGSAFDVADDGLANDSERRQWIAEKARQLGLNPLDEYENPSSGATGGHMHFSDKGGAVNVDTSGWSGNADVDSLIADTANRYGIDANLLAAIAEQESGFNQGAKSEAGALGIMQLMPDTANGLGVDATDLAGNIEGGAKYIKQMLDQFGGDVHKALEAYNGGPGNVGIAETMKYADEVMQRYEKFKAKSAGTFSWSKPAGTNTTTTDYMKIMSDNNVTADTAGDFLQYVQLLAEDDANANNEQVQKDGAKAVKAIADGSPDVMERVAKELGYGQVKQEVEQKAPNIPIPKIRQHVQQNGWVEIGNKKDADEFARTDYGKTLERVSNTRFVSPNYNAITGRVEQRAPQPQQVAQPAPQPTVQNKVQPDVASTNGQNIANNAAANNATVGNLLSSIPNSAISLAKTLSQNPAAVSYNGNNVDLNKLNNAIKNNDIKTINGFNAHMMNNMRKNNVSLDDVVKEHLPVAKDTAMRLSKIPEAIAGATGNRIDLRALQEAINNNDLSRINAISEKMAENLRSNGVSPYLAMRDTESEEEAPTRSTLPAVQGNRAPSTNVQDLGWRVEGEVESPIAPPAPYTEAQLEAPAIESDHLNSEDFLAGLSPVERGFMEYLDKMFDNLQLGFNDVLEYLRARQKDIFNKRMESVIQQGPQGLTGAFYTNGGKMVVDNNMPQEVQNAWNQLLSMRKNFGASLANSTAEIQNEYMRVESVVKDYLTTAVTEQCKNNVSWRKLNYAITGLEAIADKARRYERSVSEEGKRGSTKSYRDVSAEEGQAIEDSAVAWSGAIHQYGTTETRLRSFLNTLGSNFTKNNHGMALRAKTKYKGHPMNKAGRIEALIRDGGRVEERGKEYFAVSPNGDETKVTKGEHNYYKWLRQNGFAQQDRAPEGAPQLAKNNGVTEDNYRARQPEYNGKESYKEDVENYEPAEYPHLDFTKDNTPAWARTVNSKGSEEQAASKENGKPNTPSKDDTEPTSGKPQEQPSKEKSADKKNGVYSELFDDSVKIGMDIQYNLHKKQLAISHSFDDGNITYEEAMQQYEALKEETKNTDFPREQGYGASLDRKEDTLYNIEREQEITKSNYNARPDVKAKRKEAATNAENSEYNGFLDNLSPRARGSIIKTLNRKFNYYLDNDTKKTMSRKEYVELLAAQPHSHAKIKEYNGKKEYRLYSADNLFADVTKTEYEYFNHLVNNNFGIKYSREKSPVDEKNNQQEIETINPHSAESLKENGNSNTELDRLPKVPIAKLRQSEQKIVRFGKAIGVPVHFVSHPDKGYRGVFTHNGEVYINRNATVPAKAIFLHEFTHWLKASGKENRAVFDALAACVERESGLFHERRLKQYRDRIFGGEQMTDEEIIEEIICDAMGNSKTAERISKAIDNFAPELNQSIWGRIKAMWDKFCQMVGFRQELSSKKQSLPNGLSQQEMARFNAQLNILMSKMRTADGKPMFKVENYQLVVAENGKRPAEIFDINNVNDYTPTYNIPAMPSSYSYQVHAQREAVRQQYEGTKEWMKAPNGEPTNLTEEQWLDVRTPNFKAWFGDWENNPDEASKVVDENGEPLVVYHGRSSKLENDTIRTEGMRTTSGTGAWFSNKENISAQYGDNIYPCFLNIRSPYTADLKGAPAGEFSKAIAYDVDTNEEVKVAFDNGDGSAFKEMDTYITGDLKDTNYEKYDVREEVYDTDSLVREVRNDKNVDGVVIKNVSDIPEGDTTDSVDYDNLPVADDYVVFNSNQIKSATENTGAFSPDTNNIKFSRPDTETARLDKEYMSLVDEFNNAESDEKKQAAHDKLVKLVQQAAEKAGFKDAIPEQTPAYQIRTKAAPKKSVKVYKVFTMSDDGKPTAPITYDDDGNVIPLSQRFDITNPDVRYSRDKAGITASTDNVGIFKRAMTALENKLKGKMPDNLQVRTYEDIEVDRENARRAKAASRGKEYLDRSKEISPFEMWWTSPSRLAKKIPLISPFVQMAKIAVDKQEKLRVEFNSGMNEIETLLGYSEWGTNDKKYKERKMALQEALLQGDIARKVFTDDELKRGGLDEQTIKAYHKMRELLDKAYTMADQTYSRTKYVSRNWSTAAEADGFMNDLMKKNPFVQIIQKKQNADGTVTYTYKEPHQYTVSALTVTAAELDELKKDKNVIIKSERLISGSTPADSTYSVTYHQKKANLGKIQGYIPHIFHGWLVCEVDKNGNIIKDSAGNIVVATSKNSMSEAVKEGKKIASQNADKHYMVVPKLSKFNDGAAERAAIMGDFDYSKTMSKVANGMKMSIADAEKFMNGTVAVQNRGRFLAYAQHRKGVQGYEQNVFLATQMYFNQIARYVALDQFKRDAISTYNRLFGSFTDNAVIKRSRNAKYIYEYINDVNGVPNGVEMWMNDMLHNMGLGQEVANGRPGLWLEHMFTYPFTIAKLGILNMSSALLNLTQLFNLYGAMGEKVLSGAGYERLLKKGFVDARKAIMNKNSQLGQLVWKDLGLEAQIGIDVAGGYSKTEVNGLASLTGRLSKLAGGSMYLFRLSDTYTRAVTLLTAYNKALDEGMTKQEAIEYAKEINDKVNFDYSTADSPGIFRAFGPLSKVLLHFKKYPVKQIELFMDIFNDGRAAGLNRKQSALRLIKYTAPYMAFSGMMGIPFISLAGGILSAIMSAATGDDDWDWQQKIKQYMVETFGADNPLTLWWLYGAGSFIGVNVGSRVGVGDFMGIENREKSPIDSILGMTTATSTVAQTTKQLGYGNYAEAVKAVSPSAGNILIGLKGEVHTTRGRMKYQYQNAYEQALRMIGFNPLNETMAGDIASNDYANKQAEKRAKDDAIDAFIEEPTAENAAKLNNLGVTPKSIKTEMARRKMNRAELNKIAEEEKAAKAKKSKQKKKQYSVNDYLKGK